MGSGKLEHTDYGLVTPVDRSSQARPEEPDYPLLHEMARHAIHVSETLTVALASVKDIEQQHQEFLVSHDQGGSSRRRGGSAIRFPLRILEALLSRSESNKARLQNEIQLVSPEQSYS